MGDAGSTFNAPLALLALLGAALLALPLRRLYLWEPAAPPPAFAAPGAHGPSGLGGWLILVGVGIAVSLVRVVQGGLELAPSYSLQTWHSATTPGAELYDPAFATVLIAELLGNIALLELWLLTALLF